MLTPDELALFGLTVLFVALSPGPNTVYCVSRALDQGRIAGLWSSAGVLLGFVAHMTANALGLTVLLAAIPHALDAIRLVGALFLLWLSWEALQASGRRSPGAADAGSASSVGRLVGMGFVTNVLNPRVAIFYLTVIPQLLRPERGSVLLQSLQLGVVQIGLSALVYGSLVMGAAAMADFTVRHPGWQRARRYAMSALFGALALQTVVAGQGAFVAPGGTGTLQPGQTHARPIVIDSLQSEAAPRGFASPSFSLSSR